jgi:hypothetical protein
MMHPSMGMGGMMMGGPSMGMMGPQNNAWP